MAPHDIPSYNPKEIERFWQKYWLENNVFEEKGVKDSQSKKYVLDMFPYPSGAGLHVGHPLGYIATDIYSRYLRMKGYSVLHPMGWDAFGLPAENYAIKTGVHPSISTQKNIETFKCQINMLGLSYDWKREINTSSPEYYRWTQWLFIQLYNKGLAYKQKAPVNWCNSCQTVLANEQVKEDRCERCTSTVIQKNLEQWFFRITDYADQLLNDLDSLEWPEPIKSMQRNWIGKSEGTTIKFEIAISNVDGNSKIQETNSKQTLNHNSQTNKKYIEIFTTRPDTLFGATYLVIAPDHQQIIDIKSDITNWEEVEKYIRESKKKADLQRIDLAKEKSGVELKGVIAINPVNNIEIPIFVSDYVLSTYGTGAIMAVPAHDERDFDFARKYKLPIKQVIEPCFVDTQPPSIVRENLPFVEREAVMCIVKHWSEEKYIGLKWKKVSWQTLITGGVEKGQTPYDAGRTEIIEETGYLHTHFVRNLGMVHSKFFHVLKQENRFGHFHVLYFELVDGKKKEISEKENEIHELYWLSQKEMGAFLSPESHTYGWALYNNDATCYLGDGVLVNSGRCNGKDSLESRKEIISLANGKTKVNFKLRDWLVSRQRYWGAPIPIIYCKKCGSVPVPEDQLPVILPTDVDFKPTGESPLVNSKTFHSVTCPNCHSISRRESDTMDTFVDSSWYFLRYIDPRNTHEFASKKLIESWMPVDTYVGGAEHAVLHLLYARFVTKALRDMGYVEFNEPFLSLRNQGLILAEDGRKMSKSFGNVINPDDVVQQFGADTFRLYEMFMGPFKDVKPWSTRSIIGLYRFLEKVWKVGNSGLQQGFNDEIQNHLGILSSKVSSDIETFSFNTAIAAHMEFVNKVIHVGIGREQWQEYLLILSPFAPHISEELWKVSGKKESITTQKWRESVIIMSSTDVVKIDVQINNKSRGYVSLKREDESPENIIALIDQNAELKKYLTAPYKIIKHVPSQKIIIMV